MHSTLLTKIKNNGVLGTLLPLTPNRGAVALYRISRRLYTWKIPELPHLFYYLNALLFGCEIHYRARIGERLGILHSQGIVIGRQVRIGSHLRIYSGVVLGKKDKSSGMPVIGNHVYLGSGAKVLGDIRIGDHATIAANAVVLCDVPPHTLAAGVPARIIEPGAPLESATEPPDV